MSKAEIDTTAPFGSVKEAVVMFGDKLLGCHLYSTNLTQMHHSTRIMEYGYETMNNDELEETKQSLQRAKEESMEMATSIISLQQELQQTKTELQLLKTRQSSNRFKRPELDLRDVEDIKFVEDLTLKTTETKTTPKVAFENKKYVRFSDPPSVARVVLPSHAPELQRHSSLRMKKIKGFVPFIKGIFSKKSGNSQVAFA